MNTNEIVSELGNSTTTMPEAIVISVVFICVTVCLIVFSKKD